MEWITSQPRILTNLKYIGNLAYNHMVQCKGNNKFYKIKYKME